MTPLPCRFSQTDTELPDVAADWLVVGVPQSEDLPAALDELDSRLRGDISRLRESKDLTGKPLELVSLVTPRGVNAARVLFVGLGPAESRSRATIHDAFAAAFRSITGRKCARVAVAIPALTPQLNELPTLLGVGVGAIQGSIGPGLRKTEPSRFLPDEIVLVGSATEDTLNRIRAESAAVTLARELVNLPACDLYPEVFAERAVDGAGSYECEVWDETRLARERMGAILGVGSASTRPSRLVILRYRNGGDAPTLAFVGKGVTFDSGGLSLKTSEQMTDMKGDMAGAAAVLASIQAIAELQLKVNVLGVMPLVENMPGGKALKLGDVLTARNGKTIEVLNTDAEGRLVLADALSYVAEQKPGHIIDLATLTGSCMIALGTEIAGLMTNNTVWGERIRAAALRSGERVWPLPMDADFENMLKSNVADLKNIPPSRYGGAIAGGKFLEQFVDGRPWVHLDIAGPAWADHESATRDPGGTGAFVRTLIELAATYSNATA
jgi:leucyl aminopeptidase